MNEKAQLMYRNAFILGSLLLPGTTFAQVSTDPVLATGQRIDKYYQQRQPLQGAGEASSADPVQGAPADSNPAIAGADADTLRFTLNELQFSQSELLDAQDLQAIARQHQGRQVGLNDLQAIVEQVNQAYETAGITTARALLRAQDLSSGVVVITLVEGRLGQLDVVQEGDGRLPERFVHQRITPEPGEVVQVARLREQLVYLNRTSDVQLRAVMRPGQDSGQTDIVLMAQTPARQVLGVFVDNAGVKSTGSERFGLQGQWWGLAGRNDLLSGSLAWSNGGLEGRVGYSGLVNRRNGRVGMSVSRNQINLIDGAYRDLDITGESTSLALEYTQPWVATQQWLLSSQFSLGRSNSVSQISGVTVSESDASVFSAGLSLGYRREGLDWSFNQQFSSVRTDELLLGSRSFTTASGSTSLVQRIGSQWYCRGTLGWQFTSGDNLPASHLLQIGGIGSVRGYERGTLSGVRGYYTNLELHRPLSARHDAYVFYDQGDVRGDFPASASISSIGIGFNGQLGSRYSYSLDLGNALDEVLSEQDSLSVDFRLGARW